MPASTQVLSLHTHMTEDLCLPHALASLAKSHSPSSCCHREGAAKGSWCLLGARAGFNCAEAVNFGPPDWLPWGTYVANKYRREGRSATLSHDALLIALVTAAPDVQRRLQREAKVGTPPDRHLVGSRS